MDNSSRFKGKNLLVALGIVIVIAAIIFGFTHNRQAVNPNPKACVNRTFASGSSGKCVADGQTLLNWYLYGIDEPNYMKVSGTFTVATVSATTKAQSGASLSVSGKLDPPTWKLLCQGEDTPSWWNSAAKNAGCLNVP